MISIASYGVNSLCHAQLVEDDWLCNYMQKNRTGKNNFYKSNVKYYKQPSKIVIVNSHELIVLFKVS